MQHSSCSVCSLHSPSFPGQAWSSGPFTYSAFVWLFPCMSPHVDHQHILGFEWFLLPGTIQPSAHELFLLTMYVVIVDMLFRYNRGYNLTEIQHQLQCYCNSALEEHQRFRCEPAPCSTKRVRSSALVSDHRV